MTHDALIDASIAAALLYLEYASRARAMTSEQAEPEWWAVKEHDQAAMENWEREAVELLVYRAVRWIGSLEAALCGLGALVLTGRIGDHSPEILARIAEGVAWLGARLDRNANQAGPTRIGLPESRLGLFATPTDEEPVIARAVLTCLRSERSKRTDRRNGD